jgi:carbamoyl-phosphate synthase large subunit
MVTEYSMESNIKGKKILILGAGTWLVPHIKKAKELGLITYVTDWSNNAVGKNEADFFAPIDLRDKEGTLKYAIEHNIDAIYTSADIGVQTAAYVANQLGLCYHSEELAFNATNKRAMREKSSKIGLNIPQFCSVKQLSEAKIAAAKIGYPVVVKPVDNSSSRGVSVVNNEQELDFFFTESKEASFEGTVLIEEFMQGMEGSVEALISNGKVHIMGVCDKIKSALPYRYDLELNYPGNYTSYQLILIHEFIDKLVSGFEIKEGIIHVEIMVNSDSVKLIEFGLRGCGSKVVTHLLPKMLNFDILKYLVMSSFGYHEPIYFSNNRFGVLKFIMLNQGIIKEIIGKDDVLKIDGIVDFEIERNPNDEITFIKDGRSRPGYLLAHADNKNELNTIVTRAINTFLVTYK